MLCDGTGNVLPHGEMTWATKMTLGFNLSNSAAWVTEAVAMMALLLQ